MKKHLRDLSLIALFPALMAATSPLYIPLGSLPNITFQTFFVFLSGLILGAKKGSIVILIYILLGAIGVPVFSGLQGGLAILFSYSGGFIFGFLLATFFVGYMSRKFKNGTVALFIILFIGNIMIYVVGSLYLSYLMNVPYLITLLSNYLYLPGDIIKIIIVIISFKRLKPYTKIE